MSYLFRRIRKHIAIPRLASLHVDNSLVRVRHGTFLDPRLDLLGGGEFKHLADLGGASDRAATDLDPVADKCECVDGWEVTAVRSPVLLLC